MVKYVCRKFPKKVLQDLLREDLEDFEDLPMEIVSDEVFDNSRWSVHHNLVFKHGDKYYQTQYSRGATEYQHEPPFEYAMDEISCTLMELKEVTVTQFVPIES